MDAVATVLLRRAAAVAPPAPDASPPADGEAWVGAFETDLAARGWLLDAPLRHRFACLDPITRIRWADWICAVADETVGADRDHTPLFRAFPDTPRHAERWYVERLIVHLLQAESAPCVLCGTLGSVRPVDPCGHPVCPTCFDPRLYSACPICGRRLTPGSGYLDLVAPKRDARTGRVPHQALRLRRIALDPAPVATAAGLRDDLVARPAALSPADVADLRVLVDATAPGRLDWLPAVVPARETQAVLIAWALHATALTDRYPQVLDAAAQRWSTATDVARSLWAYSGGDPGLTVPRRPTTADGPFEAYRPVSEPRVTVAVPRVRALPRPLRRTVLAVLDGLDPATAAEDLTRHPTVWKRLAERLHPFEQTARYPRAAVVLATLRGTRTRATSALGRAMADIAGRQPDRFALASFPDGTIAIRVRTIAALVEQALADGDAVAAVALLADRPGELWRRIDHLLRRAGDDPGALDRVLDTAARTAPRVAPGVLAGAAAALRGRDTTVTAEHAQAATAAAQRAAIAETAAALGVAADGDPTTAQATTSGGTMFGTVGAALRRALGLAYRTPPVDARPLPAHGPGPGTPRRTFFPKGDMVRTWTAPEYRDRLPAVAITRVQADVDTELTARAGGHDRFDLAIIDAALAGVPVPTRERAGSEQLAGWPRGSVRPLPHDAATVRMFLHWVDGDTYRVDLDLSCAFYDETWKPLGHCDYTRLRFADRAAVHSGDLTSAPPPQGATEFLDLDRSALHAAGVRWAVPVVLSYNDVPFEALRAAFAGFSLPTRGGALFDPARVMQRFSLRGTTKSLAPLILDVAAGQVMWIDVSLSTSGYGHSVGRYGPRLGRVAADVWDHFTTGTRTTLLDLAAWHAAARADQIVVAHPDGTATPVPVSEPATTVPAIRAAATDPASGATPPTSGRTVLAATIDPERLAAIAGTDPAAGSIALLVDGHASAPWTPATAADLLTALAPAAP